MRPGRRIGIDVGRARVGVAMSDPAGILASPLETVPRDLSGGEGTPEDLARVAQMVAEHEAIEVVVGLPRLLSGQEGASAEDARAWAKSLARILGGSRVRLVDERLTTVDAHRKLHESGLKGRSHRAVVDQVAAQLILQSALDEESSTGTPPGQVVAAGRRRTKRTPTNE